jgi:hypothetical protein
MVNLLTCQGRREPLSHGAASENGLSSGLPGRPVEVGLSIQLLVLPMRLRSANHRLGKISRRGIGRVAGDAPGKPLWRDRHSQRG